MSGERPKEPNAVVTEVAGSGKKITIEVDEDDPCLKNRKKCPPKCPLRTAGLDPRFQQQDQTLRCYVMYSDFYRCEHLIGEGSEACALFKRIFTSLCPIDWIEKWDELRVTGRFAWHKNKTQGDFPGCKYGD